MSVREILRPITRPVRAEAMALMALVRLYWGHRHQLGFLYDLCCDRDAYLIATGYLHSRALGYPCDMDGSPLPWLNYPVIAFLERRLTPDLTLFEYGSGYSTLFFARRVQRVVSIESDPAWFEIVKQNAVSNVTLIHQELQYDDDYCRLVNRQNERFDIVVIDGRDRIRCTQHAYSALSDRGVVLFDDSDRAQYSDAFAFLAAKGFRRLDFQGLKPLCGNRVQTSIFYRGENCLQI